METKSETMKENKGRFPWKDWARFEVVDIDGIVLQFADKPTFANRWFPVEKSTYGIAGRWNQPDDASKTLIERYPPEQAAPAPFVFGAEHVGRRVRHRDGRKGFIRTVIQYIGLTNHFEVLFDDGTIRVYTSLGKLLNSCEEIVISLDEQSEPDQTPDLLARVEVLEAQLQNLTSRVYDLELVEKSMCESQAVTQSGDVSFNDLRFFVGETATEPDPTAAKVEELKLLFEWRDGCNYMTVDPDGDVWQWSVAPIRQGLCWTSLGAAEVAEKIGEIPPDAELSKIIITRTNG